MSTGNMKKANNALFKKKIIYLTTPRMQSISYTEKICCSLCILLFIIVTMTCINNKLLFYLI